MARKDIENAKIALKYRLYSQPTYQLIDALRETIEEDSWKVVLHYDECGTPVGCAVRNKRTHMIQVFVRKACRGKGIGSILVNQLKTKKSWGSRSSISDGKIFYYNGIRVRAW